MITLQSLIRFSRRLVSEIGRGRVGAHPWWYQLHLDFSWWRRTSLLDRLLDIFELLEVDGRGVQILLFLILPLALLLLLFELSLSPRLELTRVGGRHRHRSPLSTGDGLEVDRSLLLISAVLLLELSVDLKVLLELLGVVEVHLLLLEVLLILRHVGIFPGVAALIEPHLHLLQVFPHSVLLEVVNQILHQAVEEALGHRALPLVRLDDDPLGPEVEQQLHGDEQVGHHHGDHVHEVACEVAPCGPLEAVRDAQAYQDWIQFLGAPRFYQGWLQFQKVR